MKKMLSMFFCAIAMLGCQTHPVTPDESWSDYGRYFSSTGDWAEPHDGPVDVRMVKSAQAPSEVARLKSQGYVLIGTFKIVDAEISQAAVTALARKLNACAVVWCSMRNIGAESSMPNPASSVVGVDSVQMERMNANRPDATYIDQMMTRQHDIWMLGKKAKGAEVKK